MELSQNTKKLASEYQRWYGSLQSKSTLATINVDEVAAKVASFYEKIRGIVDWREEHLLRKTAIERMFKRRMLVRLDGQDLAEGLLKELIRGGHFPNNRIPAEKIDEVQKIIDKYVFLIQHISSGLAENSLKEHENWMLSVGAYEIEEALAPPIRENALMEFMAQDLETKIKLRIKKEKSFEWNLTDQEKKIQIYVAVHRALFKFDNSIITYHLFEKFYPDWHHPSSNTLLQIAQNISSVRQNIEYILKHPFAEKFYQVAEQHDAPYLITGDILSENPNQFPELTVSPSALEEKIRNCYSLRLSKLRGKVRRAAFYSTLSVFLSKVLIALAVEIPVDRYLTGALNPSAIAISVTIPPLLMLFLIGTAKSSSDENFQKLMLEVIKLICETEQRDTYEVSIRRKTTTIIHFIVNAVYALSFLLSFGGLIWIFRYFQFSWLSTFVFLMFLSLVAFAGTRLRQRAKELMVTNEGDNFLFVFFDIFALPMIQVGKWLSAQFTRYNILVVVFNVLIETPFQVFVEFIEQWRTFLREKKEEIH